MPSPVQLGLGIVAHDPSFLREAMSARKPEEPTGGEPANGRIAPATVPGVVELTVSDLDRSLAYYQEAVVLKGDSCRAGSKRFSVPSVEVESASIFLRAVGVR